MESNDDYDYSALTPSIEKFENPFNEDFIEEEPEDYGTLWKFRDCVKSWTLGVCRHKNVIILMHKEENSPTFLPLNIMEKVTIISPHNYNYLVLTMQAVDTKDGDMYHLHSIVVKVGGKDEQFDFEEMHDCLDKASITTLREQLTTRYTPRSNTNAAITHKRLNNIFLTVTCIML
jgi:hypothetical protein